MRPSRVCAVAASLLLISFATTFTARPVAGQSPAPSAAPKPDKKEILDKARQSYYVLQNEGLKSFQCVIQPDWKQLLAYLTKKPVSADDPRLAQLGAVQYSAVSSELGGATITPIKPAGTNFDSDLDQIISEGQQVVDGFFKSWGPMMMTSAFPVEQDANYDLSDQPDGYHFIQKVGDASVELVLSRDILLTAMKVNTSAANILILPKFSKTQKGLLLLTGVDTDINKGTQVVNFQVLYQTIEGFQVPARVSYQITLPSEKASVDLMFSRYQITKN